jgi:hypothetical protein
MTNGSQEEAAMKLRCSQLREAIAARDVSAYAVRSFPPSPAWCEHGIRIALGRRDRRPLESSTRQVTPLKSMFAPRSTCSSRAGHR